MPSSRQALRLRRRRSAPAPAGRPENLTARGRGRPKGAPNKLARQAREIIMEAADIVGGAKRLAAWARKNNKNESLFWTLVYPRLLPLENKNADSGTPLIGVQIISYREIDDGKTIEATRVEENKDPDS